VIGEGNAALLADLAYRKGDFEALVETRLDYTVSPLANDPSLEIFQGYAWNPTAFIERRKNPNEPDLAREGYWMITADYTKSFQGALKTFSFTPVFIPVARSINHGFSPIDGLNAAGKIYLLFLDTDIDLVFLAGKSQAFRLGLGLSRNLRSNWEIHGEISWMRDLKQKRIGDDGKVRKEVSGAAQYLLGLRYLTEAETTYILEFYHDGAGLDPLEMKAFYAYVDRAYGEYLERGDDTKLLAAAGLGSYGGFTPMTDYMFLRIMQKDPFGVLYLNPAVTVIANLSDGSASVVPEVVYKGFTNWELRLKAFLLAGKSGEEFGEKPNRFRLELRVRRFF